MIVGVRGTTGWVEVTDRWRTRVGLLEGSLECVAEDPVSGELKTARLESGDVAECIKRFDESVASCLERFCALRPFGYTPVRQSINSAAAQLVSRRESRKIIFLITDGLCSDAELLTDIEQDLKRAGIEIVCLGIGDDIPKIFSIQSDIKHSRQMKEAAYKLLEETFRRRH